ncbi:hypothetical protein D9M73_119170 [compost metagenome]
MTVAGHTRVNRSVQRDAAVAREQIECPRRALARVRDQRARRIGTDIARFGQQVDGAAPGRDSDRIDAVAERLAVARHRKRRAIECDVAAGLDIDDARSRLDQTAQDRRGQDRCSGRSDVDPRARRSIAARLGGGVRARCADGETGGGQEAVFGANLLVARIGQHRAIGEERRVQGQRGGAAREAALALDIHAAAGGQRNRLGEARGAHVIGTETQGRGVERERAPLPAESSDRATVRRLGGVGEPDIGGIDRDRIARAVARARCQAGRVEDEIVKPMLACGEPDRAGRPHGQLLGSSKLRLEIGADHADASGEIRATVEQDRAAADRHLLRS